MSKSDLNKRAIESLQTIAQNWYDQIKSGVIPSINLPTRTKHNIEYRR